MAVIAELQLLFSRQLQKIIKATALVEQEKFHCRFSCGTCLSLALMTAFSQVPQAPYRMNKTWVCHGMSAKKME